MIFNPVRYGGGIAIKQVDVNITTVVGGLTAYYVNSGAVKTAQAPNIKADAGSMLILISRSTTLAGLTLTGATKAMSTSISGRDIIFALVNDA